MAVRLSTKMRNNLLDALSLEHSLASGNLDIYTGNQPADADSAPTGTLLAQFSLGATPFSAAASGAVGLTSALTDASANATGTAGWFRLKASGDDDGATGSTYARIDGTCGTSGAQINMSTTSIVAGTSVTLNSLAITQPAS